MMQRTALALAGRRGGLLAISHPLLNKSTPPAASNNNAAEPSPDVSRHAAQRKDAETFAQTFHMHTMAVHERSSFQYAASDKGAEVGARNEAAFMNYEEFKPRTLNEKLVMPGTLNLLTVSPVYCALLCVASMAWGVFYWDLYARKNYETVLIARPKDL